MGSAFSCLHLPCHRTFLFSRSAKHWEFQQTGPTIPCILLVDTNPTFFIKMFHCTNLIYLLSASGGLELRDGPRPENILIGPRVGIEFALPEDVNALWRFAIAGSPWVSAPRNSLRQP